MSLFSSIKAKAKQAGRGASKTVADVQKFQAGIETKRAASRTKEIAQLKEQRKLLSGRAAVQREKIKLAKLKRQTQPTGGGLFGGMGGGAGGSDFDIFGGGDMGGFNPITGETTRRAKPKARAKKRKHKKGKGKKKKSRSITINF